MYAYIDTVYTAAGRQVVNERATSRQTNKPPTHTEKKKLQSYKKPHYSNILSI